VYFSHVTLKIVCILFRPGQHGHCDFASHSQYIYSNENIYMCLYIGEVERVPD